MRITVHGLTGATPHDLAVSELVIAGWAGRDSAAVEAHIAELEAIGVARPRTTPIFYRAAAARLTTAPCIECSGPDSSGEAECVIAATAQGWLVGIGSDHTDRRVEAYGVTVSKQMCDKPVGPDWWWFADVAAHWDRLVLRSWLLTDGRPAYQDAPVSGLRDPRDLAALFPLAVGAAMFAGTVPVHGGLRTGTGMALELHDPVLNRSLRHEYQVAVLPVEG